MERKIPPPLSLALDILRTSQGWSQKELAAASGIAANLLSDYEGGRKTLSRDRLELLLALMGLKPSAVDEALDFLQRLRGNAQEPHPPTPQSQRIEAVAAQSGRMMSDFARSLMTLLTAESRALEARQQARTLWERLKRLDARRRRALVEDSAEFRNWALSELLCEESIKVAGDSADRALELANLALRVSELAPGEEAWRQRLQGYAWAHVGNARRVGSDLPGAEEALARSQKLWSAGVHGDNSNLLNEARVLGLKSSLLRDQRKLLEALEVLEQALIVDQGGEIKYLLLNKAKLFEEMGDFCEAVTVLRQAAPVIEPEGETRFLLILKTNLATNLCFLGRYSEAEELFPGLESLAMKLGNGLDKVRMQWLKGRLFVGVRKENEAVRAFLSVREALVSRGIVYDAALVSLELAVIYLEAGRFWEVKNLARQMASVFQQQGVHREMMAALKLFQDAAERQTVTLDFVRRLSDYIRLAQAYPNTRFENS